MSPATVVWALVVFGPYPTAQTYTHAPTQEACLLAASDMRKMVPRRMECVPVRQRSPA